MARRLRRAAALLIGFATLCTLLSGCSAETENSTGASEDAGPDRRSGGVAGLGGGFEHRSAEVDGVRLHYVIGGSGDPLVLLHGFPETWYTWRGVMPALAENRTVIAVDLRGVGGSSIEKSGYDKETLAADVHGLVRRLGFEEAAVAGHDLGAWTAYAYARRYREETSHLVFMSAALPGFTLDGRLDFRERGQGLEHLVFFRQRELPEALIEGQERYFFKRFVSGGEGTPGAVSESGAMDEYVRAYSRPGRLEAGLNQYRTIYQDGGDNRRKAVPKLTMPVLALGGGSPGTALQSMRLVAEDVEGGSIGGAGHFLQEEQPERVAERMADFLR